MYGDPPLVARGSVGELPKSVAHTIVGKEGDPTVWNAQGRFPFGVVSGMVVGQ